MTMPNTQWPSLESDKVGASNFTDADKRLYCGGVFSASMKSDGRNVQMATLSKYLIECIAMLNTR